MTRYGSSPRSTAPRARQKLAQKVASAAAADPRPRTGRGHRHGDCMGYYKLYNVQVDGRYL